MFCWSEIGLSPLVVGTLVLLILVCATTFSLLGASAPTAAVVALVVYAALTGVFFSGPVSGVAPALVAFSPLVGLWLGGGAGPLRAPTMPASIALVAVTLASRAGLCGAFIALELASVAALLLLVNSRRTSATRRALLLYYWISALCALSLSLSVLAALAAPVSHTSGLLVQALLCLAVSTKLGALPAGIWVVWFYASLSSPVLQAYITAIYPCVFFCLCVLISAVGCVVSTAPIVVVFLTACVCASSLFFVASRQGSHASLPGLLALLTSATVLLMLAVL